jgi:preprotein translocase subunit SecD
MCPNGDKDMHERLNFPIAILLLVISTLACSLLHPKRANGWHVTLEIDLHAPDRAAAAEKTVAIIESRLNALGIANSKVQVHGVTSNGRILVSLPDVPDRERLKKLITEEGRLEIAAVVSPPSPAPLKTYKTKEEALASLGGTVPPNRRVLSYGEQNGQVAGVPNAGEARKLKKWVVLESPPIVDDIGLRNASAVQSRTGADDYQIAFSLTQSAADKFGAWTGAHVNDYIGVILDKDVKSIAFIKSQISDKGEISGRFTKQSAEDLSKILISGALPAPVKIVEEGSN